MKKCYVICVLLLGNWLLGRAQYSPEFYQVLTIHNASTDSLIDHPVLLKVNTAALVASGQLNADGSDLRFGSDCLSDTLFYWIQDSTNSDTTQIWVRVPLIEPASSLDLNMYYGDSLAASFSNFDSTFPDALITNGNATLSESQRITWLQVNPGDTLFLAPDTLAGTGRTPVQIHAVVASIAGVIDGVGQGYFGGTFGPAVGEGPGGGGTSNDAGSGGGSYGGVGGTGGLDSTNTPGTGGPVYGTVMGDTVLRGSGGGGSSASDGGNGGGALLLSAQLLSVTGGIVMDGASAAQPGGGQGGGGGAGGGILLRGKAVILTGTLSAAGGIGSIGVSSANDDGGGGGGGRIKVYHEAPYVNTAALDVSGGAGGPNGSAGSGQDGQPGTTFDTTATFQEPTVSFGVSFVARTDTPATICEGDSLLIAGIFRSTPGTYIDTLTNVRGCDSLIATQLGFFPSYDLTDSLAICNGDSVQIAGDFQTTSGVYVDTFLTVEGCDSVIATTLTVRPALDTAVSQVNSTLLSSASDVSYQWIDCESGAPIAGATTPFYTATASGTYAVQVTGPDGCTAQSRCVPVTLTHLRDASRTWLQVTPNPSAGRFTITLTQAVSEVQVRLFYADGRQATVPVRREAQRLHVDLRSQPDGLYLLQIQHGASREVVKLIKR